MALPRANLLEESIVYRPWRRQPKPKLISSCELLRICAFVIGTFTLLIGAFFMARYVFENDLKLFQNLTERGYVKSGVILPKKVKVPPLICSTTECLPLWLYKAKCDYVHDTGSDISQVERSKIVEHINGYREKVNNNCAFFHGVIQPASNYRKVKYSCELEKEAKFECSANMTFESDKLTWRKKQQNTKNPRLFLLCISAPLFSSLPIDAKTQTVRSDDADAVFTKLFISWDVTEVGCYVKLCNGIEYIACKSNHNNELPNSSPLYTPGRRCNVDSECTLPEYHVCDAAVGLCDYKSHHARKMEAYSTRCNYVNFFTLERGAEKCNGKITGSLYSNKEREATVFFVNSFRKLINNDCDFGRGVVKQISNYRKVKYSCALEAESKFECSDVAPETFKSDKYTLRTVALVQDAGSVWYNFSNVSYFDHKNWLIDPNNQISSATEHTKYFLRLMVSPEVTEIGCFNKICGNHEYFACKTGHVVASLTNAPLYTPGKRCERDSDCTFPGYGICDTDYGLCEGAAES